MIATEDGARRPGRRRLLEPDRRQRRRDLPRAGGARPLPELPGLRRGGPGVLRAEGARGVPRGVGRPPRPAGRAPGRPTRPRSWSSGWAASGWPWRSRWSPRSPTSARSTGSRTGPTASSRAWSASAASCSSASRCTACSRSTRPTRPTSPPANPRLVVIRQGPEPGRSRPRRSSASSTSPRDQLEKVPSTLANPAGSFSRAVFAWGPGRSVGVLDEPRVFEALRRRGR